MAKLINQFNSVFIHLLLDSWSASSSPAHTPGSIGGRYYFCADKNDYYYGTTNLGTRSRSPSPNPHIPRFGGIRTLFAHFCIKTNETNLIKIKSNNKMQTNQTRYGFRFGCPAGFPTANYFLSPENVENRPTHRHTDTFKIWTRQSGTKSQNFDFCRSCSFVVVLFGLAITISPNAFTADPPH